MTLPLNSLTPRARRVLVDAAAEAEAQDQAFVGTEHLLLALARERRGVAAQVLDQLGVLEEVVQRLSAIIRTQGGGEARHDGDQALVVFDPSPGSNHTLLVVS
jgi:ATP-dependent Clp protease ATP-binding subunit ClpA